MDRAELEQQLAKLREETDQASNQLIEAARVEAECSNGWALEALGTHLRNHLEVLAKDYEIEVTDDVARGVWLASQLVLDLDLEMMLGGQ